MKPKNLPLLLLLFSIFHLQLNAQDNMRTAAVMNEKKLFDEAIRIYSSIITNDSSRNDARLARAFTYSWKHDFANAVADFNAVLQQDAKSFDAKKGLAYVLLWKGENHHAIKAFDELIAINPSLKELQIAKGIALMNDWQQQNARNAFTAAAKIDAQDKEPQRWLSLLNNQPGLIDLDVIAGISGTGGQTATGIRYIQLASQFTPRLRAAVKFDNALALDNASFIVNNTNAPYYAASLQYKWSNSTSTKAEAGFRKLKPSKSIGSASEMQYSIEQVYYTASGLAFKAGLAWIDQPESNYTYILNAGAGFPFANKLTARADYYYTQSKLFSTAENRLLISTEYRFVRGLSINGGYYYGHSQSEVKSLQGNTNGVFAKAYTPLGRRLGIHAGVSFEKNFLQQLFTVNTGIRLRLEK